jgi:hypothetical protein
MFKRSPVRAACTTALMAPTTTSEASFGMWCPLCGTTTKAEFVESDPSARCACSRLRCTASAPAAATCGPSGVLPATRIASGLLPRDRGRRAAPRSRRAVSSGRGLPAWRCFSRSPPASARECRQWEAAPETHPAKPCRRRSRAALRAAVVRSCLPSSARRGRTGQVAAHAGAARTTRRIASHPCCTTPRVIARRCRSGVRARARRRDPPAPSPHRPSRSTAHCGPSAASGPCFYCCRSAGGAEPSEALAFAALRARATFVGW